MLYKSLPPASFLLLLRKYARPFWKHIVLLILLTILASFLTALQPVIISGFTEITLGEKVRGLEAGSGIKSQKSLNKIFDLNHLGEHVKTILADGTKNQQRSKSDSIKIMSAIFLIVVFFTGVINYIANVINSLIRTRAIHHIRLEIIQHLLSLNIGFFHSQRSGELISRITSDTTATAQGIASVSHRLIHSVMLIIIYSFYLFNTSVMLACGALGMIFLQYGLTVIIKHPIRNTQKTIYDTTAYLTSTIQETFTNIRVIKSFSVDKYALGKLDQDINRARSADFKANIISYIEPELRTLLDSVAIIGILIIATIQLINGSLNIQGFLLFIYVGRLLISPINIFSTYITWIQKIFASNARLAELFSEKPQVVDGEITKDDFQNNITLENVYFSYGSERVINNLSLTIIKGEVLALVGPSGGGKSTLTDLILRFYDPQKGGISIDGIDLRRLKVEDYRKIFGVVPQESLLFNDTISKNICYGREGIIQEDIVKAAKTANSHDFITQLPHGYDTLVGDRGVRLSGGQRQRIAIARAIVSRPEILIFDEATSSLDTESEKQVQIAIDKVLENSTAIIVAHRLSTILHADKIVVIDKGQIEAIGKHDKLLAKSPTYRRLYELQFDKGSNTHSDKQIGSPLIEAVLHPED